jgi:hypothetical protein
MLLLMGCRSGLRHTRIPHPTTLIDFRSNLVCSISRTCLALLGKVSLPFFPASPSFHSLSYSNGGRFTSGRLNLGTSTVEPTAEADDEKATAVFIVRAPNPHAIPRTLSNERNLHLVNAHSLETTLNQCQRYVVLSRIASRLCFRVPPSGTSNSRATRGPEPLTVLHALLCSSRRLACGSAIAPLVVVAEPEGMLTGGSAPGPAGSHQQHEAGGGRASRLADRSYRTLTATPRHFCPLVRRDFAFGAMLSHERRHFNLGLRKWCDLAVGGLSEGCGPSARSPFGIRID